MKITGLLALLITAVTGFAADQTATAYNALRIVGKEKGQAALNRVIELRGRGGSPQPAVWKIVLSDASARGGVREIEVQRGKIIGERTPVGRGALGEPMDFSRLNLDSDGVFTVVNQENGKKGLSFDRLDYTLRSGSGGGAPVWSADIFNGREGQIGTMQLAADSGAVLGQTKITPAPVAEQRGDQSHARRTPPPEDDNIYAGRREETVRGDDGEWSQPGEHFRSLPDFFHRLGKRVERHEEVLENFFTGKRR